jgi:serine/threonine protein kinase
MGTLLYMAPETIQGLSQSPRIDIFSLGVVAYEALTGGNPFAAPTTHEIVESILNRYPPVSDLNPAISPEISMVIERSMAKEAESRFQSAEEFAEALESAARGYPRQT